MRNRRSMIITVAFAMAMVASSAMAAGVPFVRKVQVAIARALESEDLALSWQRQTQFVRYGTDGKLETFECSPSMSWKLYAFHSEGGRLAVGECAKSDQLNEHMGEQQFKRFEVAFARVGSSLDNLRKAFGDTLKPQVITEREAKFVHITQWLISDPGGEEGHMGVAIETLLMIPANTKTVFLVQGTLMDSACHESQKLPICNDFRTALREVARRAQAAQATVGPADAEPYKSKYVHTGVFTVCDNRAMIVEAALEEANDKRIPVIETIRYKQLSSQPIIQASMRAAADEHARGIDMSAILKKVADDCRTQSQK
jgi:hypothetical protein